MIGYVTLGSNDLPRAIDFYEKLLGALGAKRVFETERGVAWAVSPDTPGLGVMRPFDGQAATHGNGTMVALAMPDKGKVDAMYALALELGGTDEGPPGARSDNFYAGYCRDLDGNKLNFFCFT